MSCCIAESCILTCVWPRPDRAKNGDQCCKLTSKHSQALHWLWKYRLASISQAGALHDLTAHQSLPSMAPLPVQQGARCHR